MASSAPSFPSPARQGAPGRRRFGEIFRRAHGAKMDGELQAVRSVGLRKMAGITRHRRLFDEVQWEVIATYSWCLWLLYGDYSQHCVSRRSIAINGRQLAVSIATREDAFDFVNRAMLMLGGCLSHEVAGRWQALFDDPDRALGGEASRNLSMLKCAASLLALRMPR